MNISLTLAQGFSLTSNPLFPRITQVDPYERTAVVDVGMSVCLLTWEQIKDQWGFEITMTPEEVEMVERGRLANRVAEDAKALKGSIDAWLLKEKAR